MRTRSSGKMEDLVVKRIYGSTTKSTESRTINDVSGETLITRDVVVPNYHKRVAQGELFFNPYQSRTEHRSINAPGWGYGITDPEMDHTSIGDGPLWLFYDYGLPKLYHTTTGANVDRLKALASTQALAGVEKPELQGLVSLAELRKTIKYVANPVKAFTDHLQRNRRKVYKDWKLERRLQKELRTEPGKRLTALKRLKAESRRREALDRLDTLSNSYLAGRYGLRPLIGEVQDGLRAIDAHRKELPSRKTARGFSTETTSGERAEPPFSWQRFDVGSRVYTEQTVNVRAGVLYVVDISDTFGLSLQQVPSALWELTFLSFMADWAANIGDYVSAITPRAGIKVLGSWVVTDNTRESKRVVSAEFNPPDERYYEIANASGEEYLTSNVTTRQIGLKASLALRPKALNWDLGLANYADMALIARNLFTGKRSVKSVKLTNRTVYR